MPTLEHFEQASSFHNPVVVGNDLCPSSTMFRMKVSLMLIFCNTSHENTALRTFSQIAFMRVSL